MAGKINMLFNPLKPSGYKLWLRILVLGCDSASHPRRLELRNHKEVRHSKEQNVRMAMTADSGNLERNVKICAEANHVTPEGSLHLRDTDTNNGRCLTQHVLDLSHGEASILWSARHIGAVATRWWCAACLHELLTVHITRHQLTNQQALCWVIINASPKPSPTREPVSTKFRQCSLIRLYNFKLLFSTSLRVSNKQSDKITLRWLWRM